MTGLTYRLAFAVALYSVWLLLSGHFNGQFLLLGGVSCGIVMWLSARMRLGPRDGVVAPHLWRSVKYMAWLAREIIISNLKVARIILDPALPIRPVLFEASAGQKTDLGRVMFANSITLTPGTISIEIAGDGSSIIVHALHEDFSWSSQRCDMDERIRALGV